MLFLNYSSFLVLCLVHSFFVNIFERVTQDLFRCKCRKVISEEMKANLTS